VEAEIGLVHTEITLKNGGDVVKAAEGDIKQTNVRQVTVQALVDTGAWTLVIDEQTRRHLGLRILGTESATLADGSQEFYSLAGPLEVNWKDRRASFGTGGAVSGLTLRALRRPALGFCPP